MVFTGQLSKACQRCRQRRLRCDQRRPSCSACIRAKVTCTGYRDADAIRIKDQTELVRSRVTEKASRNPDQQCIVAPKVRHLAQNLEVQGREMFFAWYLPPVASGWDFLHQYAKSHVPAQVKLSLDAVSLAFLSHQVASPIAKQMARQKYVAAIKNINQSLVDPALTKDKSTFEATLLLDLYEKISKPRAQRQPSSYAHLGGALALVKLRGFEHFKEPEEVKTLTGLILNIIMSSFSHGLPTPAYVWRMRKHCEQYIDTSLPRWRLGGIMAEITDLAAEMTAGRLTSEERVSGSIEHDQKLKMLDEEARTAWSYERIPVSENDGRVIVPDGFPRVYDLYLNRALTQARQNLMLIRMLLCEEIIESCATSQDPERFVHSQRAKLTIQEMAQEICASIPQMTDCEFAARYRLSTDSLFTTGSQHRHTVTHLLDVYTCIFTLFLMSSTRHCPRAAIDWAMKQLYLIADHFGMEEASTNLNMLKQEESAKKNQEAMGPSIDKQITIRHTIELENSQVPSSSLSDITSFRRILKPGPFAGLTILKMPNLDGCMEWAC